MVFPVKFNTQITSYGINQTTKFSIRHIKIPTNGITIHNNLHKISISFLIFFRSIQWIKSINIIS